MKITLDTDNMGVDEKGEALRGLVFNQNPVKTEWGYWPVLGCYSTFELNPGFVEVDPEPYRAKFPDFFPDEEDEIRVEAYESPEILAIWHWDGDGSLLVWIKGEPAALVNHDCKCTYDWFEMEANCQTQ